MRLRMIVDVPPAATRIAAGLLRVRVEGRRAFVTLEEGEARWVTG